MIENEIWLGKSWKDAEKLDGYTFSILPRIGESLTLKLGDVDHETLILDIRHTVEDDSHWTDVLIWPHNRIADGKPF